MSGIIIDGNNLGLRGLDFIHNRNALEQRGREHAAEIGLRRDLMAQQGAQFDTTHRENIRQFDATTEENRRQFDADLQYRREVLGVNRKQIEATVRNLDAMTGDVQSQTRVREAGLRDRDAGIAAEAYARAEAARIAGDGRAELNILRGIADQHKLPGQTLDELRDSVAQFGRTGDTSRVRAGLASDLELEQPGIAEGVNRTRQALFSGVNLSGSRHQGIGIMDEIQQTTDRAFSSLQRVLNDRFGGDMEKFLADKTVQDSLIQLAEAHPEIHVLTHNRENVSSDNPDPKLRRIGDTGYLAVSVQNKRGERGPITQRGSISSENPDDPAIAVSFGDLYNMFAGISTINGGDVSLLGPMLDAVSASTAPVGRFGGDGGLSREQSERRARISLAGEGLGLFNPEQSLSALAGEPVTPGARDAANMAYEADIKATAVEAAEIRAWDKPEEQQKRTDYWQNNIVPQVVTDITVTRPDAGKGMTWQDQWNETYRGAISSYNVTPEARARFGYDPNTPITDTQRFNLGLAADIQATLANPRNLRMLTREFGLKDRFGRPIKSVGDLNNEQTWFLARVVEHSRKKDLMDQWIGPNRFTIGMLTREGLDAVLNNEEFKAKRGVFE